MKFIALLLFCVLLFTSKNILAQIKDTTLISDTTAKPKINTDYINLLDSSVFLNHKNTSQVTPITSFKPFNYSKLFYFVAFLFLIFGIIKWFFGYYFETLIRVFFNTTLKQNQLTDQLVQAKLPSLIFNFLFVILAGIYIYALLHFLQNQKQEFQNIKIVYLFYSIAIIGICYVVKYFTLLFLGWLTNLKQEVKTYIFIIFLLNKILGIFLLFLLPFIIFGNSSISSFAVLFSIIAIVLSFLLRYYRSFSQLKSKISMNTVLFLLIVFCVEVMPLTIIFKFCSIILNAKA